MLVREGNAMRWDWVDASVVMFGAKGMTRPRSRFTCSENSDSNGRGRANQGCILLFPHDCKRVWVLLLYSGRGPIFELQMHARSTQEQSYSPKTTRISSRRVSIESKAKLSYATQATKCRSHATKKAPTPNKARSAVISPLCQNTAITILC